MTPPKLELIHKFCLQMNKTLRKMGTDAENRLFDPTVMIMLWVLMQQDTDDQGVVHLGRGAWANAVGDTARKIRSRDHLLAQYGLIKVVTPWRNDGTLKRLPMQITINPKLVTVLGHGVRPSLRNAAIKHFIGLGLRRVDASEIIQGFETDCKYGVEEPIPTETQDDAMAKLNEMVASIDVEKANKNADLIYWRDRSNEFVEIAALMWVRGQSMLGYGQEQPNWVGSDLSPAARRERTELTKTFQQYGGLVTGLAWYVYCGGVPAVNEKTGKREYIPDSPHRQFVGCDKKPSHFAKHFNAILKDPIFKTYATLRWDEIGGNLKEFFSDYPAILEIGPRDGETVYDKLGYDFGKQSVSIDEVNPK